MYFCTITSETKVKQTAPYRDDEIGQVFVQRIVSIPCRIVELRLSYDCHCRISCDVSNVYIT